MKLCIPFNKPDFEAIKEANSKADMLEFWFDQFTKDQIDKILKISSIPILYKFQGSDFNLKLLANKIDFIDFDYQTESNLIENFKQISPNTKVVISFHDFEKTPDKKRLEEVLKEMQRLGADVCKFAVKANNFFDALKMLSFSDQLMTENIPHLALSMGKEGEITRKTAHIFHQNFTFAVLNKEKITADGQLELNQLQSLRKLI